MSRLARQTANRLSQENYSPTMIIGILRLIEFGLLAARRVYRLRALCRPSAT
jgi:hypoxanthine phosphoribosyltransferase